MFMQSNQLFSDEFEQLRSIQMASVTFRKPPSSKHDRRMVNNECSPLSASCSSFIQNKDAKLCLLAWTAFLSWLQSKINSVIRTKGVKDNTTLHEMKTLLRVIFYDLKIVSFFLAWPHGFATKFVKCQDLVLLWIDFWISKPQIYCTFDIVYY